MITGTAITLLSLLGNLGIDQPSWATPAQSRRVAKMPPKQPLGRRPSVRIPTRRPQPPAPPPRQLPPRSARVPVPGEGDAGTGMGPFTGAGAALGYYAGHTADPFLELPPVPSGAPYLILYAPTGMNADSCLEAVTAYRRYPGDPGTRREFWIYNHCAVPPGVATSMVVDIAFANKYMAFVNDRTTVYVVQISQSQKPDGSTVVRYDADIYNFQTGIWEWIFSLDTANLPRRQDGTPISGGWSAHENYFRQANICPSYADASTEEITILLSGVWVKPTPSNSVQILGGWCWTELPPGGSANTLTWFNQYWGWRVDNPR